MQKSLFSLKETTSWEYEKFKNSPLGQLYGTIPWTDLVSLLPTRNINKGPTPYFDAQGMLGLMFLKHYTGLSDQKLIESINFNSAHQFFCNMRLGHLELIRDTGIISRVRSYLARHLDLENLQELLIKCWKTAVDHPQFLKMDTTHSGTAVWKAISVIPQMLSYFGNAVSGCMGSCLSSAKLWVFDWAKPGNVI